MKIKIDDEYGIKSNARQYVLCEIKEVEEENEDGEIEEKEKFITAQPGCYGSIPLVLNEYKNRKLRTTEDINDWEDVKILLLEIQNKIDEIADELTLEV